MLKISKKFCLLMAGASFGWSWAASANAASPLLTRADAVFAEKQDNLGLELVDYQAKMMRQQERDCRAVEREQTRMMREQERIAKKSGKSNGRECRPDRCRDGMDWGGMWDGGCDWLSGCGSHFTDELGDPWTVSGAVNEALCIDEPCFTYGGWIQYGYTNKSDGTFNTRPNSLNNHQSWFYIERVADGSKGLDFGGRADVLYGLDANNTQAFGNNPGTYDYLNGWDHGQFGWALPQLYGQVAYGDLSVKIGHFYTLHGYEVVGATGNFFYSHALTMNFIEPFTHTGAVATYQANDDLALYFGYVYGWDSGFDQLNGASAYTGGFSANLTDDMTFVLVQTIGRLGWVGDGFSQSAVLTTSLTDELTSVIGGDILHGTNGIYGGTTVNATSIYNYLIYAVSDRTGVGMRNEWTKIDGTSYHTFTAGLNYKPMANLVIRPEYRYQYSPAGDKGDNPIGIPVNQSIFGVDAVLTF